MASIFGHTLAAYTIGKLGNKTLFTKKVMLLGIISAVIPDVDIIAFNFGIDYSSMLGHRGLTHSLFFAMVWALILVYLFHRSRNKSTLIKYFVFYVLCVISHSLLDAITNGGAGVAFFAPFNNARYFLPWNVIEVSPIGVSHFFSKWGGMVLLSELKYIGFPCFIILAINFIYETKNRK